MHFALLLGPRHGHDDERRTLLQPRTLPEPPTRGLRSASRQQGRRRQRRRQRGKLRATGQSACKQTSSETSAVSWCLGSWGRELTWGQSGHARKRRTTITRSIYIFCKSNSMGFPCNEIRLTADSLLHRSYGYHRCCLSAPAPCSHT